MKHALTVLATLAALAPGMTAAQHSAYSGQEVRPIKALSEEEIRQYRAGAGMGYARAAELNAFPGPQHVLELAQALGLSPEQRSATQRLMDSHKAEARAIGAKLVEAERALDRQFASGNVDETALAQQVKAVAALQGEYRLSHLETHRRMHALLTAEQVRRYDYLRGYTGRQQGKTAAQDHGKH